MAGTFPRIKTWQEDEDVLTTDLNNEFNNILNNMTPSGMDDYSLNVPQMQLQVSPGDTGTESKATSMAGELERIRFVLARIVGKSFWYQSPSISLEDSKTTIQNAVGLPKTRIVSCKRTSDNQPGFLKPAGTAANVTLEASIANPFVCFIDDVQYTFNADIVFSNLSTAPAANNLADVNDVNLQGQEWSKLKGEDRDSIAIDSAGSEVTSQIGQMAAFKNPNSNDEILLAFIKSAGLLTRVRRGNFFDSSYGPIKRDILTDNDSLQLMRLAHLFLLNNGVLDATYRTPVYSGSEPTSPTIGDYWFDLGAQSWKRYTSTGFVTAGAILVGQCVMDASDCIAARSADPFIVIEDDNTLVLAPRTNSSVKTLSSDNTAIVYGNRFEWKSSEAVWNFPLNLASGVAQATSKAYYFYLTDEGEPKIDDQYPHNRMKDLKGWYHPHKPWLAIGGIFRDGSGNFDGTQIFSFSAMKDTDLVAELRMVQDMYNIDEPTAGYLPITTGANAFDQVRRELFPRLYAKTGDRHGAGDGIDTFHIPAVAGLFPRFTDESLANDVEGASRTTLGTATVVGAIAGAFQADAPAPHAHGITDPGHTHLFEQPVIQFPTATGPAAIAPGGLRYVDRINVLNHVTNISINSTGVDGRPKNFLTSGYVKY